MSFTTTLLHTPGAICSTRTLPSAILFFRCHQGLAPAIEYLGGRTPRPLAPAGTWVSLHIPASVLSYKHIFSTHNTNINMNNHQVTDYSSKLIAYKKSPCTTIKSQNTIAQQNFASVLLTREIDRATDQHGRWINVQKLARHNIIGQPKNSVRYIPSNSEYLSIVKT
jgi:hypothetical protein